MSETWAVFGGSFDPPHVAHTLVVAYVLGAHPIDRVLVTPAAAHAFGKRLRAFEDRMRMCELAFAVLQSVEVSPIERELPAPSLTLRTLQALHARHPDVRLRLVLGTDLAAETHAWHDFAKVEALAPPLWVGRQGYTHDPSRPAMPEISSTEIRRRLVAGEPTDGLLAPAVARYIAERGLYREA